MKVIILGSAAGGGFPQWNCCCPVCSLAWKGDARVSRRTQSSVAISGDGANWFLLNASPDLRQQLVATPALWPRGTGRDSPVRGVFLTNGDIDHLAGLLSLREGHRFTLFATQANLELIAANSVFRVLDRDCVAMKSLQEDISEELGYGLRAKPFFVPGKVPLHEETETIRLGEIGESTLGLEFECGGARVVHIPGCAKINDDVLGRASRADLLLFDGTTFTDDEMVALGLSSKTAWRMGHMAISGAQGSLAAFAKSPAAKGPARRRIYTHINNTNPILIKGSPERRAVEADGWEVAYDGMEISL